MTYEDCKRISDVLWEQTNLTTEDIQDVVVALEKQIPKKPSFSDDGYDLYKNVNIYGIYCPNCSELILGYSDNELTEDGDGGLENDFFNHSVFDIKEIEKHLLFCGSCGQAIDWSEVEE